MEADRRGQHESCPFQKTPRGSYKLKGTTSHDCCEERYWFSVRPLVDIILREFDDSKAATSLVFALLVQSEVCHTKQIRIHPKAMPVGLVQCFASVLGGNQVRLKGTPAKRASLTPLPKCAVPRTTLLRLTRNPQNNPLCRKLNPVLGGQCDLQGSMFEKKNGCPSPFKVDGKTSHL